MRRRTPPRSTTARRIGRGTVSVQRLLGFFGFVFSILALYLLPNSAIRDKHEVLVRSHASVMTGLWFLPQCSCLMPRGWCWSLWGAGGPWLQHSGVASTWLSRGLHSDPWLGPVAIVALCFAFLSSPDGSYTEEQSQESEVKVLATDFDDEFDDEEPLPAIGTCKALYTFEGNTDCLRPSSLSVVRLSFEGFRTFLSGLFRSARRICDSNFFLVDSCIFCLWVWTVDQLLVSLISADGME